MDDIVYKLDLQPIGLYIRQGRDLSDLHWRVDSAIVRDTRTYICGRSWLLPDRAYRAKHLDRICADLKCRFRDWDLSDPETDAAIEMRVAAQRSTVSQLYKAYIKESIL